MINLSRFAVLLLVSFSALPVGAHYSEEQRRQAREWQRMEEHYGTIARADAAARSSSPFRYFGNEPEPSAWEKELTEKKRLREAQAKRDAEYRQWLRENPPETAEQRRARLQQKEWSRQRLEQQGVAQEAKDRRREALLKDWPQKLAAADGLLPNEPEYEFDKEADRIDWYAAMARGRYDPFSSIKVAEWAVDGKIALRSWEPLEFVKRAKESWSLKWAVAGEMMLRDQLLPGQPASEAIVFLQDAALMDDASGGRARAMRVLRRIYREGQAKNETVPANRQWQLRALAWAVNARDAGATEELQTLVKASGNDIGYVLEAMLARETGAAQREIGVRAALAKVRDGLSPDTQYVIGCALQERGEKEAWDWFAPVLQRLDSTDATDNAMCARLHFLAINGDARGQNLDPRVFQRAKNWVMPTQRLHELFVKENPGENTLLSLDEKKLLSLWFSGAAGDPADVKRAMSWAVQLALGGNGEGFGRAGNGFRMGVAGWPRDDSRAQGCFEALYIFQSEETGEQKWRKAQTALQIAGAWQSDTTANLKENAAERFKYLQEAARLDPDAGALELAFFLRDSRTHRDLPRARALIENIIAERQRSVAQAQLAGPEFVPAFQRHLDKALALRREFQSAPTPAAKPQSKLDSLRLDP